MFSINILLRCSSFKFAFTVSPVFCFSLTSLFYFSRATKPRLRKTAIFVWNLCITLLNLNAAHSKFIRLSFTSYRCWWVQKWKPWLSREWNLFKHRWILWMCMQRWILWRRTQLHRLVTKDKLSSCCSRGQYWKKMGTRVIITINTLIVIN